MQMTCGTLGCITSSYCPSRDGIFNSCSTLYRYRKKGSARVNYEAKSLLSNLLNINDTVMIVNKSTNLISARRKFDRKEFYQQLIPILGASFVSSFSEQIKKKCLRCCERELMCLIFSKKTRAYILFWCSIPIS